jgi:hypothetical protein
MTRTIPTGWAKDNWRQYESPQDHAERVERAEHEAHRYFQMATVRQKAAWDQVMSDLRGLRGPVYDRARAAANAAWARSTVEAADLMEITAGEIMVHAECPEEIAALWDDLEAREAVAAAMKEVA